MKYIVLYDNGSLETLTTDNPQEAAISLFKSGSEAVIYEYAEKELTYFREYGRLYDENGEVYDPNTHALYGISPQGVYDLQAQDWIIEN